MFSLSWIFNFNNYIFYFLSRGPPAPNLSFYATFVLFFQEVPHE